MIQRNNHDLISVFYWFIIAIVYLIASLITHAWHLTWAIWPIAAVVHLVLVVYKASH